MSEVQPRYIQVEQERRFPLHSKDKRTDLRTGFYQSEINEI